MNTCKTCLYWKKSSDRFNECEAPLIFYGYNHKQAKIPDNGVLVEDDEGWGMYTGPEFGCVHHKEK